MRWMIIWAAALCLSAATQKKQVELKPDQVWTDTGIDIKAGDTLTFLATGTLQFDAAHAGGPEGLPRGWNDLLMQYPVMNSGRGALIGRFTNSPAARPFLIGPSSQRIVPISGRLFLGFNLNEGQSATGSFKVTVEITEGPTTKAVTSEKLPHFSQQMLDSLPGRVNDSLGNAGDRVNFILVGPLEKVQEALTTAGWVVVDKTKKEAVLHGLLTSLMKEGYVSMPMSELQLFGRSQDFGYAQADPLRVVESRHHFRIWKAPLTADGVEVWAGAGTHDIGFDRDNRNNGVTHKIDPATDGERDYIGQSLEATGLSAKEEYMTPLNTIKEARTATGGGFTSDGRTLIIYLR